MRYLGCPTIQNPYLGDPLPNDPYPCGSKIHPFNDPLPGANLVPYFTLGVAALILLVLSGKASAR